MARYELKPCPFCGRTDTTEISHYRDSGSWWHFVECTECMANGPVGKLKRQAVDAWNDRRVAE